MKRLSARAALWCMISVSVVLYVYAAFSDSGLYALTSDGLFMTSYVVKIMSGYLFGDYFYQKQFTAYPPAYFWLVALYGKIFGLTSMIALKSFVVISTAAIGVLAFWAGKKILGAGYGLAAAFCMLFLVPNSFITHEFYVKPYTIIASILIFYWVYLMQRTDFTTRAKQITAFAVALLIILFDYYFIPFYAIPALLAASLINREKSFSSFKNIAARLLQIVFIAAVIFILFKLPHFIFSETPKMSGMLDRAMDDNLFYVTARFVTLNIGMFGSLFFLGVISFVLFWKKYAVRKIFLGPVSACYIYFLLNLVYFKVKGGTIGLGYLPFFLAVCFVFPAAYLLLKTSSMLRKKYGKAPAVIFWLLLFAAGVSRKVLVREPQEPFFEPLNKIGAEIVSRNYPKNSVFLLSEGTYLKAIPSVLPVYLYLSPSFTYSHPSINYWDRMVYLANFCSKEPGEFYEKAMSSPYGPIAGFGMKKEGVGEIRFVHGAPAWYKTCNWQYFSRKALEDKRYYDKVYEDNISVLYLAKTK